ncbi:cation transporter [Listeria seeligeri]|uniref:cation diffusion facilitator family transporter n=1 Tax=Listeria seeligeri TaxID=1640 RepID=UPI001629E5A6|nr:cation diffusion facilitator family transporter [Listeria seeligeri]MBC1580392.1 cation transporter [Listeria seeligeri]MBC1585437.1 cation transporter [Listeria seeligeri]MBC1594508.1 cation transporter [Listeria seeligeri]MBC1596423.1 cation transporter [Listeria seeligeri]MBC1600022.1 cation transporter [Listeria seeligeri]
MNHSNLTILSVCSNFVIVVLKLVVGFFTGSVAVISEGIHSSMDLFASIITFFSIRISNQPADEDHPYGHGKAENIAGTIETLLIFVAGIWIIIESVNKLVNPHEIRFPALGIMVMLLGALINIVVSRIIKKAAEEANSVAMKSNALHLYTDVFTSLGIALSLFLVYITGWLWLDPVIAILTAFYIMFEAYKLLKESFPPLMDKRLSMDEEMAIKQIILTHKNKFIEFHDFRSRRAGAEEYIDFHLVVSSSMTIESAHSLCDEIEAEIMGFYAKAEVLIHLEPEEERVLTRN